MECFGWSKKEILKNYKIISNSNINRIEKAVLLNNYNEMLGILEYGITKVNFSKGQLLNEILSSLFFYNDSFFKEMKPIFEKCYQFLKEEQIDKKSINEREKINISNDQLLTIIHDYFDTYQNKDYLKIFNKTLKEDKNFIELRTIKKLPFEGMTYSFSYVNPSNMIYVNKKNTLEDLITLNHEFIHLIINILYDASHNFDYQELSPDLSTFHFFDYLDEIGLNENEISKSKLFSMFPFIEFNNIIYKRYLKIKSKENVNKIFFSNYSNKELIKKFYLYDEVNRYFDKYNSLLAYSIYKNYSKDEGLYVADLFLQNMCDLKNYSIVNDLDNYFNEIKKNNKILKRI